MNYINDYKTMREQKMDVRHWLLSTSFRMTLLVLIGVFGIMYVVQTSSASTTGYEMRDLEKQIQILEQDNQRLEFEIASNRSMKSIQSRLQGTSLVMADNVEYATLVGTAVAMR
ncbi:MAG: hypothetical protein WA057_03670 [Candidatus Magasanikiibacteriota bacterium]